MKILFLSHTADGMGIAQRLRLEGHSVAVWVKNAEYSMSGKGVVERPDTWRQKLIWADLVVCDMVGMGDYEATFRRMGKPYLCCSPLMDVMELDRGKGMELFKALGMDVPPTWKVKGTAEAESKLKSEEWGDGFVLKPDGNIGTGKTFVLKDQMELPWALDELKKGQSMVVQRVVKGIEVSTEAWFNGRDFIPPFNHTFEEKRFLQGNLGPNTGCMGNVVITRESNRLTQATVERLAPFLRKVGWRGPVDINAIVNRDGAFVLEATARFGYDAIEALVEGLQEDLSGFLFGVATGTQKTMAITKDTMMAVRLVVLPYPLEDVKQKEWGQPILGLNTENLKHIFLCNTYYDEADKTCKVAPADGVVLKVTSRGERKGSDYVSDAKKRAYRTLEGLRIPGKMYRLDIGDRVNDDIKQLQEWGWI